MISSQKALQIWRKAEIHRKACEIGRPTANQPFQLCQCCDQIIYTQPIRICQHTKQLQIFGYGYPLWFSFIKHCMLLIFVLIVSKTATEIYIATHQNYQFCYGVQSMVKDTQRYQAQSMRHIKMIQDHLHLRHNQNQNQNQSLLNQKSQNSLFQPNKYHKIQNFQSLSSQKNTDPQRISQQKQTDLLGKQKNCTSFLVYLSFFKQQKMIQNVFLKLVQFFAILVSLIYFRNNIIKKEQFYKERICSMSNYTLMIRNLPSVPHLKKSIINLFNQRFNKSYGHKKSQIQQIIYVFQDQKLKELTSKRKNTERELLEAQNHRNKDELNRLSKDFQQLNNEIQNNTTRVRKQIDNDQVVCDKVFIIMLTQKDKKDVLQKFHKDQQRDKSYVKYFEIQQKTKQNHEFLSHGQIRIQVAHQPNQIIWNNIDHNQKDRKIRILIGWIVTLIILAIATLVFYFIIKGKTKLVLKSVQNQYQNSKLPKIFKLIAALIVLIALIGILLFNKFILQKALRYIVKEQRHGYIDRQDFSFATKYAIAIFFTTGLMTLIVQLISYQNFYTHHLGIIQQQSLMFFIVALLIPLILWINPFNMYKNWQRQKVFGKLLLQQQANKMMEDYPYDLSKRYSQIFKLIWLTFLYAGLIPLGSFLTLLGLFIYYWVEKYNFIHYCTRNPGITGKMAIIALKAIDATLFLMYAGQFLFNLILRSQFDTLSLVLMIIGIAYMLLPTTDIIWQFNNEQFQLQQNPFDQAQYLFRQTYMSMHPMYTLTHRAEIQKHRSRVKKFYQEEIKKQNYLLGAGRGMYFKDKTLNFTQYSQNQ